ncbi:hypothetical protein RB195_023800 [Necator americanus]|uniref:Uncharacterized protein n=1 Tax=Necator americanus TaxID=51031 RepID=A0ABR1EKQ7_NECAM
MNRLSNIMGENQELSTLEPPLADEEQRIRAAKATLESEVFNVDRALEGAARLRVITSASPPARHSPRPPEII